MDRHLVAQMPIPGAVLGFVFTQRVGEAQKALAEAYPEIWDSSLRIATIAERSRARPHKAGLDLDQIRDTLLKALESTPPAITSAVLFVVDARPADLAQLADDLVYHLPQLDVVGVRSAGSVAEALRGHLEFFGLLESEEPANVHAALTTITERHVVVQVLNRCWKSAEEAATFMEPRRLMGSLHALKRVVIDWQGAKKRDHQRSRRNALLTKPTREALRTLIQDARFDVSDSSASHEWLDDSGTKRDYGWHLKWSLASERSIENHVRVHWAAWFENNEPCICIGHCGEHL